MGPPKPSTNRNQDRKFDREFYSKLTFLNDSPLACTGLSTGMGASLLGVFSTVAGCKGHTLHDGHYYYFACEEEVGPVYDREHGSGLYETISSTVVPMHALVARPRTDPRARQAHQLCFGLGPGSPTTIIPNYQSMTRKLKTS